MSSSNTLTSGGGGGGGSDDGILATMSGYITGFLGSLSQTADSVSESGDSLSGEAESLLSSPRSYIFARVTEYVLATVIGVTLGIADAITSAFESVIDAFQAAGASVITAFDRPGTLLLDGIRTVNATIATAASDQLGVAAPFVTVGLYGLEFALVVRAAPAVLAALGEFAGSLPVVGDAINALITGLLEFIEG